MDNLEALEEKIRQKESVSRQSHKKMKVSGKSVFKLQEIIKREAKKHEENKQ